jgi:hypothetical protein
MEKLKAIRGGHKSAVTRLINRTDEKIAENDVVDQELHVLAVIETLVKKRNLLKTLDGEILEVTEVEDMEQEIMDTEIQTQATVNHSYLIHSIIQDSQLLTLTLHTDFTTGFLH